ncbi:hypothetical protein ACP5PY_29315 [Photobacterium leiognathi subsp. mandapamensis]
MNPWVDHVVAARNVKQKRLDDQQAILLKQQAQADKKASMSEHAWRVDELRNALVGIDNSNRPPLIRAVVEFFLATPDKTQAVVCRELYQLARDNEYHQKPKKKAKEQKQELANLMAAYGVSL